MAVRFSKAPGKALNLYKLHFSSFFLFGFNIFVYLCAQSLAYTSVEGQCDIEGKTITALAVIRRV